MRLINDEESLNDNEEFINLPPLGANLETLFFSGVSSGSLMAN